MLRLIVILILLLVGANGFAQSTIDSPYKNSIKKILSLKYVSDVVEDLEGYIWIATDEGVYRYNGTQYVHFGVKNGLPTNDIIYLNVDSRNRVWLTGFYNGLYYIENQLVKKVAGSENNIDIAFGFEKNDTLFFHDKGVDNSFYVVNGKLLNYENKVYPKNKVLDYYPDQNLTVEYDYYKIFINNKYILLKPDHKSAFFHYPNLKYGKPTFIKSKYTSNFPFISRVLPNSFLAFENGNLYNYKIDNNLPPTANIYNFGRFEKGKHSIFLTENNKIIVYTKGIYNELLSEKLNKLQFNFSDFYFVYIDSNNNFWFIDKNKSLYVVANDFEVSKMVFNTKKFKNINEDIIDFVRHEKQYIVATNKNKIYLFDPKTQQLQLIKDYKNDIVRSLYVKNDTLIVNNQNNIQKFKLLNQQIKYVHKTKLTYKITPFYNNEMFYVLNYKIFNSKYVEIWQNEYKKNLTAIALDATNFYVTTYDHLIRIDRKTKKSIRTNIQNGSCIAVYKNNVVVGTKEGALLLFDKNLKLLDKIQLNEKILAVKYDAFSNWIYVQTKSKILFYSINQQHQLQFAYQINNLANNERIVALCFDAENIYYCTETAINRVQKKKLIKPLKVTLDLDSSFVISTNQKIKNNAYLKRKENSLQFNFSLKTTNDWSDFKVYYDLIYNKNVIIKNQEVQSNKLTFYNLNPGSYSIHFKVVPKYGNSKPTIQTFSFDIAYYLWETTWFKIVVILAIIAIVVLVLWYFRNKKYKKIRTRIQLNELELKALRAQMNPHFMFNTLNSMQSSVLLDDEIKVNNYFAKFAKLLRSTLDIVNKEHITLADEMAYIDSYIAIENLKTNQPINLTYTIDESIDLLKMKVPVMLLQPFVENAVIHGLSGLSNNKILKISINKNSNSIIILIEDNGIGRNTKNNANKEEFHKSYATKIIQNRLNLYKELFKKNFSCEIIDLVDANNHPLGTKVILTIAIIDSFNVHNIFK